MKRIVWLFCKRFYDDNSLLYFFMQKRKAKITSRSRLAYCFSTLLLMLYLWPVRRLFKMAKLGEDNAYYESLQRLLRVGKVEGVDMTRVGAEGDGGYVMLNDFQKPGIAYSFGISDEISWDKGMASRGYDVFMYDHTIEGIPEERPEFHFFKEGIAGSDTSGSPLHSLEYYIKKNHHEKLRDMILKIDVEGAEWDFLSKVKSSTLEQFDQIVFELHWLNKPENFEKVLRTLEKLNRTHRLAHLHLNNYGGCCLVGDQIFTGVLEAVEALVCLPPVKNQEGVIFPAKAFPDVVEATYVSKTKYHFVEEDDRNLLLPSRLDYPNGANIPDFFLGCWNRGEGIWVPMKLKVFGER